MFRKKRQLITNDEGHVMVEYAFVAPTFFLLLLGAFEVASLFFVQTSLEAAIFQASRFGRTGDIEPGKTQEQTTREIINDLTYGMLAPSRLHLRIQPVANFRDAEVSQVDTDSVNFGGANEPIVYTVTYDWPMFTQLVANAMGSGDVFRLTASSVVMNEPF